jgi:O-antigen/teichoic acid export membrane protein
MITRSITVEEYGIYGNITDVLTYFTLPSLIIPFWITRFTARKHTGSPKTGLATNLLLSTLLASIYMLLLPTITSTFLAEAYTLVYAVIAIEILQLYTIRALGATLQAKKPQATGYGFLIFEVCKVIIGFILIMRLQAGLLGVVSSVILAYVAQLTFYLKLVANELKEKIRWDYIREWFRASPINLYNIGGQRLATFPLILLFIYASEIAKDARAFYGVSLTIANIIGYSSFLAFALYPRLLSKSDPEDVTVSLRMVSMFMIPMAIGAIVLSDSYLIILEKSYSPARPVLILLAAKALCISLSTVFNNIVSGTEKLDVEAKISLKKLIKSRLFPIFTLPYVQAAVTIPLTWLFLTFFTKTAIEAAIFLASVILATEIALLLSRYFIAKKSFDFRMPWRNIAKYTIASAVMATVLLVLPHPTRIYLTLLTTLLGGALYMAVLLLIDADARSLANSVFQALPGISRLLD